MKVHYLQHVPFETLGSIEPWLLAHGHSITRSTLYDSPTLPEAGAFDFLIVLGGPMSANDEDLLPWLRAEKQLLAAVLAERKPVLGICLGAQLMAATLGARVYPNSVREIGWHAVLPATRSSHPLAGVFAQPVEAFHWHGETFDLPAGATHLARSDGCAHQAFVLGERALGLQFHLETTPQMADALLLHCADDLQPGPYVQSATAIRATPRHFQQANAAMGEVLRVLTAGE